MASLGLLVAGAGQASAESPGWYGSAGYGHTMFQLSDVDVRLGSIEARVGYQFRDWIGFEIEGAVGVGDHRVSSAVAQVLIQQNHSAGAFAVARFPMSDRATLLARLGYREADFTLETRSVAVPLFRLTGSEGGVIVGVGAEYAFEEFSLRADYASAIDATPFSTVDQADTLSLSIVKRF